MLRPALTAAAVTASAVALSACGSSSPSTVDASLRPIGASGPSGSFRLSQDGDKLTARWSLSGLTPGPHASHVHGPDGACAPAAKRTAGMAVVLPDVVADPSGKAQGSATLTVHESVVGKGFYVQVHRTGTPQEYAQFSAHGTVLTAMPSGAMSGLMRAMDKDPGVGCASL